jgi:hypothetical protein
MTAMQFVIYQETAGKFHWRLIGRGGHWRRSLNEPFGSMEAARLAVVEARMRAGGRWASRGDPRQCALGARDDATLPGTVGADWPRPIGA